MSISTVIPVRDTDPRELHECLASIRRLRISDELLLVDDRTARRETQDAIRDETERSDTRVIVGHVPGLPAARAAGVHEVNGDWVLNFDSDDLLSLTDEWNPQALAPINICGVSPVWPLPTSIWEYLADPGAIQNGSIVRKDIALYLAAETASYQEDLGWAFRLWMTAWRDKLEVNDRSGLHYIWRRPEGRDSMTANAPFKNDGDWFEGLDAMFEHAMRHVGLCAADRRVLRLWYGRKRRAFPHVESRLKAGARVDVHVISFSKPPEWLDRTLRSLEDEPCNVHVLIGGFPGSIGAARALAFQLGECPYVSFVDDDDLVEPGAMARLVDLLDENPKYVGAYTDLTHLHVDGTMFHMEHKPAWTPVRCLLRAAEITHLKVMRRCHVEPFLDELSNWPTWEEYVLTGLMSGRGPWMHVPMNGAYKRMAPRTHSSLRLSNPDLWNRAVKLVTPVLMGATDARV